jgi:hypothetical protein
MAFDRASQQAFFGVSALLFAASAAVTIVRYTSMSAMGDADARRLDVGYRGLMVPFQMNSGRLVGWTL